MAEKTQLQREEENVLDTILDNAEDDELAAELNNEDKKSGSSCRRKSARSSAVSTPSEPTVARTTRSKAKQATPSSENKDVNKTSASKVSETVKEVILREPKQKLVKKSKEKNTSINSSSKLAKRPKKSGNSNESQEITQVVIKEEPIDDAPKTAANPPARTNRQSKVQRTTARKNVFHSNTSGQENKNDDSNTNRTPNCDQSSTNKDAKESAKISTPVQVKIEPIDIEESDQTKNVIDTHNVNLKDKTNPNDEVDKTKDGKEKEQKSQEYNTRSEVSASEDDDDVLTDSSLSNSDYDSTDVSSFGSCSDSECEFAADKKSVSPSGQRSSSHQKRSHSSHTYSRMPNYSAKLKYICRDARYFLIKSNNHENVALSKAKGVWSTPPQNEIKLNQAYKDCRSVILIFSVKESGKFQGFARLAGESRRDVPQIQWVLPPGLNARALGSVFQLDWVCRHELSFTKTQHLYNPWNEGKAVKIGRDGQEIEPRVGEELCRLFQFDEVANWSSLLRRVKEKSHRVRSSNRFHRINSGNRDRRGYHRRRSDHSRSSSHRHRSDSSSSDVVQMSGYSDARYGSDTLSSSDMSITSEEDELSFDDHDHSHKEIGGERDDTTMIMMAAILDPKEAEVNFFYHYSVIMLIVSPYNHNRYSRRDDMINGRVNDGLPTEDYSNILSLVDLILSLPVQSAECERVFSNMKLVKSDWRSVLKSKNLSDQLMVILATNDIDQYDPLPAIRLWNSAGSKPRHPCTAPYGVRSCNADLESDNECNSELSDYDDDDTYDDERDI
ncbi:YTH domain-containing protein 1 [Nymphon striatum]|nr:YTH domain-containing protein 1 [Nymphon striatum]